MELFVKNMVCDRCILMVRKTLSTISIDYKDVELGRITLNKSLSFEQANALKNELAPLGFELLEDKKSTLVAQVKGVIIKYIHGDDLTDMNKKLSVLISEKLGADYTQLSSIFSGAEGITIEKYAILQRIERAKELLEYNELNLG